MCLRTPHCETFDASNRRVGSSRTQPAIPIELLVGLAAAWWLATVPARAAELEYNRDIRPILADKCFVCHGPDRGNRKAALRLDTAQGAYSALESDDQSKAIVPRSREDSEVYRRITDEEATRMPPASSNLKLSPEQIELIGHWIDQGAEYQPHWSFLPPKKTSLPDSGKNTWVQNEIDAFVLRKMRDHGLAPNPLASREHLLRRVAFDIAGLPPTLAELDAFLADEAPDAFDRVVDRLLASKHFGERMASDWLDVARYSDTYGLQVDHDRYVWPWRDGVIRSFNRNLPYDAFVTQQLAGDLLPDATQEEILATTFCRLHPQEAEGGSIPEEFRAGYVADRLQTFSTAFLGLTLECSKCHDHKYDPFTQREYYELASFFDNIDEAGLYSFFTTSVPTPTLLLADEPARQTIAAHERQVAELEQNQPRDFDEQKFQAWRASRPEFSSRLAGEIAHLDFEDVAAPNQITDGRFGHAALLTGDNPIPLTVGNFHRHEPFSVSLWMNTPDTKERAVIFHRSRAWTDAGSRGYELLLDHGRLNAALVHFDPGNSIRVRMRHPLPVDRWHHVVFTYDGSSRANGMRLYVNGVPADLDVVRDSLSKDITGGGGDHITIGERFRDHGFTQGKVDEFRVYSRELVPLEVANLHDGRTLCDVLAGSEHDRACDELLREYYLKTIDSDYLAGRAVLLQAYRQASEFIEPIPEIMVMREMDSPRPTYVFERGEYSARREEVASGTPAAFLPFPEDAPRNRLGLARWLTSPQHPLTARVAVNRYWQMLFGAGLVRTPEDLGNQGEWPSHPELLDWLSRDFIEHGWNIKRLLKQIVLSSTYQQSVTVNAEKEAADPENRWLSRARSDRFPAEMLRDNALAASGLLVDRVGGTPVKPYEVEVAFKPLEREQGEGLYRRSLYTYWSRTGPAPDMMALDAAKRDVCQVRRERTLSPLQPLVLLNSPQFVEAARMLAQRLCSKHSDDTDAALTDMFRWTTSRRPSATELDILRKLYLQHLADFSANRDQAQAFLKVGDSSFDEQRDVAQLAAMAGVANMLLNFDECVFRR